MGLDERQIRSWNPQDCIRYVDQEPLQWHMLDNQITEFLADFKRGTHAVLFYDTAENKREVLFNHLKYGHDGNEGLTYVCSEESPQQIRNEMKQFGIDADNMRWRNRLTINNYDSVYIVNGKVNIPRIAMQF